ncbi:hypothetical protein ACFY7C_19440 [Streptomyces sp. NPDC012769]|uniref:hypothetical protein n=1 Tax=Streptomyces sp. NPDC012769 TaxID=3364848 RepID=UPI0036CE0E99
MTTPYGFTVRPDSDDHDHWRVHLPHQCDDWVITSGPKYGDGVPHADAVADLRRFIAEAQEALQYLVAREEYGDDD